MSRMYPVYDKTMWEALQATITAGVGTAFSTYASVDSNSTGAMGAAPGATTACLVAVAFEEAKNLTHLMYWRST